MPGTDIGYAATRFTPLRAKSPRPPSTWREGGGMSGPCAAVVSPGGASPLARARARAPHIARTTTPRSNLSPRQ
eukprot:1550783-Rhodomonas_salina.1